MLAGAGGGGALAEHADDVGADARQVDAQVLEHANGHALALADQTQEQVLGADVVVAELPGLIPGELEDALGAGGEGDLHRHEAGAAADDLLDLDPRVLQADAHALEGLGGHTGALANQPKKDLLGADEVVTQAPGFFLRQHDHLDGFLSKSFEHFAPSSILTWCRVWWHLTTADDTRQCATDSEKTQS
ncbi:hypothetical protein D3C86_1671500 [compost metagenome]